VSDDVPAREAERAPPLRVPRLDRAGVLTRRRIVVLSSAFVLLGLGVLVGVAAIALLETQFGRNLARDYVEGIIAPRVKGKLHIGRITGLSIGGAVIDSAEIRGLDDSVFVSIGRLTAHWDARDLIDKRTLLSRVEIDRPVVHLRKDSLGVWNWKRIFPPGPKKPRVPGAERGWGDYIVADSVVIRGGTFILTMPWHPDDSLRGAKRDSAIAYNLRRKDKEVHRIGPDAFDRTWRWNNIQLISGYARIADPDSVGRLFQVTKLDVDEVDPPFAFRNVRGGVRQRSDSLWLDLAHFDLPASTGRASGKVVWGSDLPTRYDLRVIGDSVSLADVAWVYPTLPRTGGGSMELAIRNQRNLSIIDYAISKMDVRTTRSRLRGNMTFGVGGPVLIVKDMALEAAPVNFDLLRAFAGGPFPYDWQGDLTGTVRGRGGPVNRFQVDEARITFADANVRGAVTRATASGELDILFPEFTRFRGLDVDVAQLDLRTIQYLNPNFPRVNGIVSGTATLDSLWLDVRFRNADLTHRDGPGDATRATGSGRVTIGDVFTTYDLALNAQPLSFTTIARSYPAIPLRGSYQGPLRIQGDLDDLQVTADLTGPAGSFAYDGRVDGYPKTYGARGTLRFANLDVRTLLENDTIPTTSLNGRVELDVSADSAALDPMLASMAGIVSANLERSLVDSVRIFGAIARIGFSGGRARVDTMHVDAVAGSVSAHGGVGLVPGTLDSLRFKLEIDSLGGVRRYLGRADSVVASQTDGESAPADSIDGTVDVEGWIRGRRDSLGVDGSIDGRNIWVRGDRAKVVSGRFAFADVTDSIRGSFTVRADTAVVANVAIDSATASLAASDRTHGTFGVHIASANGPQLFVDGNGQIVGDTTLVTLDSLSLAVRDHRLTLQEPTRIVVSPDGIVMDSVRIRDVNGGTLTVVGSVPVTAPISLSVRADSVELGDIGELIQSNAPFSGVASFNVDVSGVRADPRITMSGALNRPRFGDVRLDHATLDGAYAARRMDATLDLLRGGRSALAITASIPVDLALTAVPRRMLSDSLRGKIRSDSVELAILETISPSVVNASGVFAANLDIGGVWPRPTFNGNVTVARGALGLAPLGGVRLSELNADLEFLGDSINVSRFSVATREERTGTLTLRGYTSLADYDNPRFNLELTARDFHIIERPRIAHLDVSAGLRLEGSYDRSQLTGSVTVERGTVFIPELIDKQVVSLDSRDLYSIIDTTLTTNRTLLPKPPPELVRNLSVENVQVRMGSDVWLRSAEANINLGGSVGVTVGHRTEADRPLDQLALEGALTTNRGTYRLNLAGIVQRTFMVENGSVTFYGDPDFNPTLNINALHTVRRVNSTAFVEQDIRIRVHIGGTLAQPQLSLASADSLLNISQTDLVSYLVTGAPSFNVSSQSATASLLQSAGSVFGDWVRTALGGAVDVVDIEFGRQGLGPNSGLGQGLNSIFGGARLGVGQQVGDRAFVRADVGVCQVRSLFSGSSGSTQNLADAIGVRLDYRLSDNLIGSAGYEPPTNALLCNTGVSARGFAPTPRQWGFDLIRSWRF
jgi:translocation and assembly module TamB